MIKGVATVIRENLEAFAIAIAMALVIRHFCLEAFRIPTGSMMPTLYGNHLGPEMQRRKGDRILVDKVRYLLHEPRRYEVAVFHYPLNERRNFIKRIIGLGGETLRLIDGDIWVSRDKGASWKIQRKPEGVRDQLLLDYYPEPVDARGAFADGGTWVADSGWSVDEVARKFEVAVGAEAASLKFDRKLLRYREVDRDRHRDPAVPFVGDARITFGLTVRKAGQLEVHITEHGLTHQLVLGASGSYVRSAGDPGITQNLDVRLEEGGEYSVSFANVDDTLVVDVAGERVVLEFPCPYGNPPDMTVALTNGEWFDHDIVLVAQNLEAEINEIDIDRDVYYLEGHGWSEYKGKIQWEIPEDSYFMLGDNNGSSRDSRLWTITRATLKDGRIIEWDTSDDEEVSNYHGSHPSDDRLVVVEEDVAGTYHEFWGRDVQDWEAVVGSPFVPRSNLIGRALAVFWPIHIPRVYPGPSRIKLIR